MGGLFYFRMGYRCPGCNGKRGRVYASVMVMRKSPYGAWVYWRFTHRSRGKAAKRIYCYVRWDDPKVKELELTPDFAKLKAAGIQAK